MEFLHGMSRESSTRWSGCGSIVPKSSIIRWGENLSEFYKKRVGKYRIIYSYDENPDDLVVRLVGTRDSIYQEATKKLTD